MPVGSFLEYYFSETEDAIEEFSVPGIDDAHRSHWL